MYYKDDIIEDYKFAWRKPKAKFKKLKGFNHIRTGVRKYSDGKCYLMSKYTKEKKNGLYITTITNTFEGWCVHLFYGGAKFTSSCFMYDYLHEAEEQCNLYLDGKLIF